MIVLAVCQGELGHQCGSSEVIHPRLGIHEIGGRGEVEEEPLGLFPSPSSIPCAPSTGALFRTAAAICLWGCVTLPGFCRRWRGSPCRGLRSRRFKDRENPRATNLQEKCKFTRRTFAWRILIRTQWFVGGATSHPCQREGIHE